MTTLNAYFSVCDQPRNLSPYSLHLPQYTHRTYQFGARGVMALAASLSGRCDTLTDLCLSHNRMGDDGAAALADAARAGAPCLIVTALPARLTQR